MNKTFKMIKHVFIVLCISANFKYSCTQDISTFINSKKSINVVDDRYISVVIDPILLTEPNINSRTLMLAKHLSPAFVRIQGFSTNKISLSSDFLPVTTNNDNTEDNVGNIVKDSQSAMKLTITPSMWKSLNQWLISANLTPVFALSDKDRTNDAWNPKSVALPLMALADRDNTSCFWEIDSDLPHKTLKQYADDVTVLRHILDAFPGSRNSWSVVGGEMSHCALPPAASAAEGAEIARKLLKRIERNVDAVNWAPNSGEINFPAKITKANPLITTHNPSIWTTAPRNSQPTSFTDALIWAKNLGETAAGGYNVIFRQPKIKEFVNLTPAFWISLFHKKLMGNNVLDVKTLNINNKKNCYIYAHCTKNKNYFEPNGAVTIFVVNMEETETNITTKFLGTILKSNEIHSYILTSNDNDSSEIYLNGDLLTISDLNNRKIEFNPQPRSVKPSKSICLNLPAKSIGFFVIPISGLSACNHGDQNTENIRASTSTESETDTIPSMNTLHEKDSNEKYYKNLEKENKLSLQDESKEEMIKSNHKSAIQDGITKLIMDRSKQGSALEIEQKKTDLKQLLTGTCAATSASSSQVANMEQNQETTNSENSNDILGIKDKHIEETIIEKPESNDNIFEMDNKIDIRRKRDLQLISFEIPDMDVEAQARKIRKTEEILNLDPISEFPCNCNKFGKVCTCRIRLLQNLLKKFLGTPHEFIENIRDIEPEVITEKILNAIQIPVTLMNVESTTSTPKDLQAIKKLLEQYQSAIKNIVTSIKKNDAKKDTKDEKNIEMGNSNENEIPRYKLKRSLSPDVVNENIRSKQLKQTEDKYWLRNKRQPKNNNAEEKSDSAEAEKIRSYLIQQQMNINKLMNEQIHNYHPKMADGKILAHIRSRRSVKPKKLKREISETFDSVEKTSDDNRTTKFNKTKRNLNSEEDKTKEVDIFLNEISKEGKNIPKYLKHIQEDIYLVKPYVYDETKSKIFSENNILKHYNKMAETTASNILPTEENKTSKAQHENDSISSTSEEYVDALEADDSVIMEPEDSHKQGLVDNVFHTMFDFLNDFHNKIINYLHYLSR